MIELLETSFTVGPDPTPPHPDELAYESGTMTVEGSTVAAAMLSAAWAQVETYTGKTYRDTTSGTVIAKVRSPIPWQWPRYPFPASVTFEAYSQGTWVPWSETYLPYAGLLELEPFTLYRITQNGTVPGATITPNVEQAVYNLALYQLIQSPARREFQSHSAGDSSLTRERLMTAFHGSGAGALLAGEVRL